MEVENIIKKECLRRGYSSKTIRTYINCVNKFFKFCNKSVDKVSKTDVREFLDKLLDKNTAGNTINVYLNALKFLFEECLRKRMKLDIKYSKKPKTLPVVLTQEETRNLLESIKNKKHKLMIKLMYSAGLRVGELIRLKVKDFEFKGNYGWVREGKGKKDRLFIIARKLSERLIDFIKKNKLNYDSFLFKGNKRSHISSGTINEIIKQAAKRAKIEKNIHSHTLRHSFATHLIENGYGVNEVQSLLGHKSPETTMMYVHMANPKLLNIKSPLDSL